MGVTDVGRQALRVPYAVTVPDRILRQSGIRTRISMPWSASCCGPGCGRWLVVLEEIPDPGDFVEYGILDKSIIVVRVDSSTVRAYYNACRHRGVQLVKDRGSCASGFVCPFHG